MDNPFGMEAEMLELDCEDINALVKYFNFKREPSCGSRCIDMGRIFSRPHAAYPPYPEKLPTVYKEVTVGRQLNELHLVYVDSGSGWYKNDAGDRFRVTPGTALLLYPNAYHSYAPDDEQGWSEFWVGCDGSYPGWLIQEDAFHNKNTPTRVGRFQGLSEDFSQLCLTAMSKHSPAIKSQLLGGIINRILGRMLVLQNSQSQLAGEAKPEPDPDPEAEKIAVVVRHLDANLGADVDMGKLPKLAGMRYDKLSRLFQNATGKTPHQYYLDRKIQAATEMLRKGMSVKETAYQLCFESPYYFSRLFKKKIGEAPQQFKDNDRDMTRKK